MDKLFAKLAFETLGTSSQPTEYRHQFKDFIDVYMSAVDKKQKSVEFKKNLHELFSKNPESVSFEIYHDRYDDCYMFSNFSRECDELYSVLSFCEFQSELYNLCHEEKMELSPSNIDSVVDSFFSERENLIYDMVENYEKNLLGQSLSQTLKHTVTKI